MNNQERKDNIEQEYNSSLENYDTQYKLCKKQCYGNKTLETLMETVFENLRSKETEIYVLKMLCLKQDEIIENSTNFDSHLR